MAAYFNLVTTMDVAKNLIQQNLRSQVDFKVIYTNSKALVGFGTLEQIPAAQANHADAALSLPLNHSVKAVPSAASAPLKLQEHLPQVI